MRSRCFRQEGKLHFFQHFPLAVVCTIRCQTVPRYYIFRRRHRSYLSLVQDYSHETFNPHYGWLLLACLRATSFCSYNHRDDILMPLGLDRVPHAHSRVRAKFDTYRSTSNHNHNHGSCDRTVAHDCLPGDNCGADSDDYRVQRLRINNNSTSRHTDLNSAHDHERDPVSDYQYMDHNRASDQSDNLSDTYPQPYLHCSIPNSNRIHVGLSSRISLQT